MVKYVPTLLPYFMLILQRPVPPDTPYHLTPRTTSHPVPPHSPNHLTQRTTSHPIPPHTPYHLTPQTTSHNVPPHTPNSSNINLYIFLISHILYLSICISVYFLPAFDLYSPTIYQVYVYSLMYIMAYLLLSIHLSSCVTA